MPVKSTPGLSRRSLLHGAATAGAAGLAVTAFGAAPAEAQPATRQPDPDRGRDRPDGRDHAGHQEDGQRCPGPITVHIRDHTCGEVEVFWGMHQARFRDQDLASRIAGSIRR